MSYRTRTCLGCDGTGHFRPRLVTVPSWCGPHHLHCDPCFACEGSGNQTEPESLRDAMADAATLFRVACDEIGVTPGACASAPMRAVVDAYLLKWGQATASELAHAAFLAVPALKEP